jgi:hypothetical protein
MLPFLWPRGDRWKVQFESEDGTKLDAFVDASGTSSPVSKDSENTTEPAVPGNVEKCVFSSDGDINYRNVPWERGMLHGINLFFDY